MLNTKRIPSRSSLREPRAPQEQQLVDEPARAQTGRVFGLAEQEELAQVVEEQAFEDAAFPEVDHGGDETGDVHDALVDELGDCGGVFAVVEVQLRDELLQQVEQVEVCAHVAVAGLGAEGQLVELLALEGRLVERVELLEQRGVHPLLQALVDYLLVLRCSLPRLA